MAKHAVSVVSESIEDVTVENPPLEDNSSETSPLLRSQPDQENAQHGTAKLPFWQSPLVIISTVMLVILLVSIGDQISASPQQRILESIICYRYYEGVDPTKIRLSRDEVGPGAIGGVEERFCKVEPIQAQLAMLMGYQDLWDGIPSLLLAIPYGWIADKYGRRHVLLLGLLSIPLKLGWIQLVTWFWQAFDIRMTWFSSITYLSGGGAAVTTGICLTVVADVVKNDERAEWFLRFLSANLGSALIMPPVSAWLMDWNPWIPSLMGTGLMFLCVLILVPVPETLDYQRRFCGAGEDVHAAPVEVLGVPTDPLETRMLDSWDYRVIWRSKIRPPISFLLEDWRVPALIFTFIVHFLTGNISPLLLQFVSKSYELRLSQATLLVTIKSAVNMVLVLIVLPYLTHTVTKRWKLSSQRKDLYLARASCICWAIGWYMVGFAPNVVFMSIALAVVSCGVGSMMLIRAYLTSLVPATQIARVFSAITIIDTIGLMFGSPLLSRLFQHGIVIGGVWTGLPFYFLGLLCTAITVVIWTVRIKKTDDGGGEEVLLEG